MFKYKILGYSLNYRSLFKYDKNKIPHNNVTKLTPSQTMEKMFKNGRDAYLWSYDNLRISNYFVIKKVK